MINLIQDQYRRLDMHETKLNYFTILQLYVTLL